MTQSLPKPQSSTSQKSERVQHLWLLLKAEQDLVHVTELIALSGTARSFAYTLPIAGREAVSVQALNNALRRCTANVPVALHSPHEEFVRLGDRRSKRPPELTQTLSRRNMDLTLARRINGLGLFEDYVKALHSGVLPAHSVMSDYTLHTSCLTDGAAAYVGAILSGEGRMHTWRNTLRNTMDLTAAELQAIHWAFTCIPEGSRTELHPQSPRLSQLFNEPESIPEPLRPALLKVARAVNDRQLRYHVAKQSQHSLLQRHARLLAGAQFADAVRSA